MDGIRIHGQLFPLGSIPHAKVFDCETAKQIYPVKFLDADTGEAVLYTLDSNGDFQLNADQTEVVTHQSTIHARVVFESEPPAPFTLEMVVPLESPR